MKPSSLRSQFVSCQLSARPRRPLLHGVALALTLVACSDASPTPPSAAEPNTPSATPASPAGTQKLSGHRTLGVLGATAVERLDPSTELTLTIGLPVRDLKALDSAVDAVSDPNSASYRQFVTPEEFAERFGATKADYEKVVAWAKAKGLTVTTNANRLVIDVTGSAATIEAALYVHLHQSLRSDGTKFHAPDVEPSLDLDVPVGHVSNLENYVLPRAAEGGGTGPGGSRQGADLRGAYASCAARAGTGQFIGIFMLNDNFLQSDVDAFVAAMGLSPPFPVEFIPASNGTAPGIEATLDVEVALAMAPRAHVLAFTGDTNTILSNMAAHPEVKQLSSSWFVGIDATSKNLLAQLALQGQSFFEASGDGGGLPPSYFSVDTDFRLQATVTNVGGTALQMGVGSSYVSESAWQGSSGTVLSFKGGGGIPIPSYQVGLANGGNGASSTYRNMPDVSAEGSDINLVFNGASARVGGTSAAAPIWAGFMALVNQRAQEMARPSIGFANPALYALARSSSTYAAHFNDITTGTTPYAEVPGSTFSYSAVAGYDLATGLGSPKCALINTLAGEPRSTDILWRHSSGAVSIWQIKNAAVSAYRNPGASNSDWVIQGTGDFNHDSAGDILWRSTSSGAVSIWNMRDGSISANYAVGSANNNWSIQGIGDFNGDGTSDILWRDSYSGAVSIWQMAYGSIAAYVNPGAAGSDWQIQGVGDFNGDGTSDILWRHSTGALSIWQIRNGAVVAYPSAGPSVPSTWQIQGTGDFNGDGTSDILWRNTGSGAVAIWQMRNGAVGAYFDPGSAALGWTIQGTGDFNNDGISDILWRGSVSGTVSIWQMANSAVNAYINPGSADSSWVIRGTLAD